MRGMTIIFSTVGALVVVTVQGVSTPSPIHHPVHILSAYGATSSFDGIFFTKCEQEKKSLLYLKVKYGTFKCVTTALLHKQKSDTSQDALKMSQNISIVPVKPDVGHAKGKN